VPPLIDYFSIKKDIHKNLEKLSSNKFSVIPLNKIYDGYSKEADPNLFFQFLIDNNKSQGKK
jgi:hypothetical protein